MISKILIGLVAFVIVLVGFQPTLLSQQRVSVTADTNGNLGGPTNFFASNVLAGAGMAVAKGVGGKITVSTTAGGTNTLYQTNGVSLGSAGTVNYTTGVTGHLAGAVAHLGVSAAGGGGEANVNGEVSVTNATKVGLVYDKVGITNRLRSVQAGYGASLTNEGTNVVFAVDSVVMVSHVVLNTASNALNALIQARQWGEAFLSNMVGLASTVFTNVPLGGTNISVRTVGGTNFIDTKGQLNNWASYDTNAFIASSSGLGTNVELYTTTRLFDSIFLEGTMQLTGLPAQRALISDASQNLAASPGVSSTELEFLDGVTAAIQTQFLNATNRTETKQKGDAVLTNLVGLASTVFTNVPNGGTNISIRTTAGTNFIDTTVELNNWSQYPTNVWNSRQGGDAKLTNLVNNPNNSYTNGTVSGQNITLTTNSGVTTIAVTETLTNIQQLHWRLENRLIPTNSVLSNVVVSATATNRIDLYATNNLTFTNWVTTADPVSQDVLIFITPQLITRTINWGYGNTYGVRFLTNVNAPLWGTLTNDKLYAVSHTFLGTNIFRSISLWE